MENITIKNEPSTMDKSIADIPRLDTAAYLACDPYRAKPNKDKRSNSAETEMRRVSPAKKETRRREDATRRKQVRSTLKARTASKRHETKQHKESQQTMTTSDILGGFKRMHITLPPIATYIPSSTLTLAPLNLETTATPPTTEAKERNPITSTGGTMTEKETTGPLFDLIGKAILSTPDHRMTSPQISIWMLENHPHRCTMKRLTSYITTLLSEKEIFKGVGKMGRCYIWTVLPDMEARFSLDCC